MVGGYIRPMPQINTVSDWQKSYPNDCKVQKPGGVIVGSVIGANAVPNKAPVVSTGGPPPVWTHVQSAQSVALSGTSGSIAFASPITSGNIVVGGFLGTSSAILTNVTDDKGNAYVFTNSGYQPGDAHPNTVTGFRSAGPITNGAKTLLFTYQTGGIGALIDEFSAGITLSGISLDGSQLLLNTQGTAFPGFQTVHTNILLYSVAFFDAALTSGAGWTTAQGGGSNPLAQWKQQSTPSGSTSAVFGSNTGDAWATVFGINAASRTSWELRQNAIQRTANSITTGSVTFPKAFASGSVGIGTIAIGTEAGGDDQIANITSLADDKGNNWQIVAPNARGRAIIWTGGPVSNGPQTLTCICNRTETVIYFLVNEFLMPPGTSICSLDGSVETTVPPGPPYSSGTITTTAPGELLYGYLDAFTTGGTSIPNNNYSALNGLSMTWSDAFRIGLSAGTESMSWLGGTPSNTCAMAAFRAS